VKEFLDSVDPRLHADGWLQRSFTDEFSWAARAGREEVLMDAHRSKIFGGPTPQSFWSTPREQIEVTTPGVSDLSFCQVP
jgi:hypothetical protein